jgi:excisionase family DNA binding protein
MGGKAKGYVYERGDGLLTTVEAAEVLDVTPRKAREWARAGKLPAYLIVGTWRFPVPLVRELRQARQRDRSAPAATLPGWPRIARGDGAEIPSSARPAGHRP